MDGTWVFLNMVTPFLASIRAMSCGVETITAPFSGTRWAMVSCASPVPGGMSSTRTSRGAQATSLSICVKALCTMGPRQIMASSSLTRKPMLMVLRPCRRMGASVWPSLSGFSVMPSRRGMEGP